jgi:hypothetical protein
MQRCFKNIVLALNAAFVVAGCTDLDVISNHPPTITRMTASRPSVGAHRLDTLRVEASDPEGDAVSFRWSTLFGSFLSADNQPTVVWVSPNTPGNYAVTVLASDGKRSSKSAISIHVVQVTNVYGHVWYDRTKIPIEGVNVWMDSTTKYQTGSDGFYEFDVLSNLAHFLTAGKPQYSDFRLEITPSTDSLLQNIMLRSSSFTFSISGGVANSLGQPLDGIHIAVLNPDQSISQLTATSDTNGFYILSSVPVGDRTLIFSDSLFDTAKPIVAVNANVQFSIRLVASRIRPPVIIDATALSTSEIRIGWTKLRTKTLVGYNLYRRLLGGPVFQKINDLPIDPNQNIYTDSGLAPRTAYDYRMSSMNIDSTEGSFSAIRSASTLFP